MRCPERESRGVQCELEEGHAGAHGCPKAVADFDRKRTAMHEAGERFWEKQCSPEGLSVPQGRWVWEPSTKKPNDCTAPECKAERVSFSLFCAEHGRNTAEDQPKVCPTCKRPE